MRQLLRVISGSSKFWEVAVFVAITVQLITAQVPINSTALSSPRKAVSSVSIEDRVYFVGGFEFNQKVASDKIEVFNAINQTWITPLYLPSARGFVTPVVVEPNIYFIGGISQDNPPYFYQPSNTSFVQIQSSGPTVREPIEIYLFNSTLTVIGLFSVDFYDLNSGNWSYNSNLTAIIMSLTNTRIIAHQDYVFVIGGQDMKTNQISTTAWIFNHRTQRLARYDNMTTASMTFVFSSYEVSNNVLVVRLDDRCLLYNFARDKWYEELAAINTVSSFTLNDITHMFGDNYVMYDWSSEESSIPTSNANIKFGFLVNDTIVYLMDGVAFIGGKMQTYPQLKISGAIRFAQLTVNGYTFADDTNVYWFELSALASSIKIYPSFKNIYSVIVSGYNLHVFDYDQGPGIMRWTTIKTQLGEFTAQLLSFEIRPLALINDRFVDPVRGILSLTNNTDLQPLTYFDEWIVTALDENTLFVMKQFLPQDQLHQYQKMDIYNYINDTWTTEKLPDEFFVSPNMKSYHETFMNAAAFNGSIMVWTSGVYGVYDIEVGNWTTYTNVTNAPADPNDKVISALPIWRSSYLDHLHFQNPVIDGIAYVNHENAKFFYKFAPDKLTWDRTKTTGDDTLIIEQPAASDQVLYVSMRASSNITYVYYYDTLLDIWQATLLPSPSPSVAITAAGDYVIAVCSDRKLHIFSVRLGYWNTQELDYEVVPSTIIHVGNVTLIAGGATSGDIFSDTVLIISDDLVFIERTPNSPTTSDSPAVTPVSDTSLTLGELIAAIVVPIVVVLSAALALLLVLLKKKRKKKSKQATTIGLEQQFGEWFTPYDEIEFGEQLGQGANGQVFKGKWKNTDVALKVSMTQANQSVISELSLMINMRPHPNVVQLFGFSVHPETNSVILIIEYCNGGSLDNQLMDENAPVIPINQKLEWLRGIARGVVHLHSNKIVHRDIAARNVLLHQGEPKLTDFGMSRIVDSQQQRGTTKSELGPIRWMSPESLSLKQYSTKSDVWSFGILMYEVIAQQEPHLNADPITTARQIRDEGLTPQVPSSCPPEMSSLMKQCWHKTPEQRPTMEEVLQLLEQ